MPEKTCSSCLVRMKRLREGGLRLLIQQPLWPCFPRFSCVTQGKKQHFAEVRNYGRETRGISRPLCDAHGLERHARARTERAQCAKPASTDAKEHESKHQHATSTFGRTQPGSGSPKQKVTHSTTGPDMTDYTTPTSNKQPAIIPIQLVHFDVAVDLLDEHGAPHYPDGAAHDCERRAEQAPVINQERCTALRYLWGEQYAHVWDFLLSVAPMAHQLCG